MAIKDIHLNLLSRYELPTMMFLENGELRRELNYDNDELEITIKLDTDNAKLTEEISLSITNLIMDIMQYNMLKEYIWENYSELDECDKDSIYQLSYLKLREQGNILREKLISRVRNYILNNDKLNIDGFIKFRIRDILDYVPIIGDTVVEEYMINKDQNEFISVLKQFIELQEEKIDLLRVHINPDYSFILYDKEGKRVKGIEDEEITNIILKENLNYEDFLISTLLSLCPSEIEVLDVARDIGSFELIRNIKSIFGSRVKEILSN